MNKVIINLNEEFINSIISVIDMQGKNYDIDFEQIDFDKKEIDISQFNRGVYIIKLTTPDNILLVQLIKQ